MRYLALFLGSTVSVAMALTTASCGHRETNDTLESNGGPLVAEASPEATQTLEALRMRFQLRPSASLLADPRGVDLAGPVIGRSAAERFEIGERLHVRPRESTVAGATRRTTLTMPAKANDAFELADRESGVSVEVAVSGAKAAAGAVADGVLVYRRALDEATDLVQRPVEEGTEDYLSFDRRPAREEVRYDVTLGPKVAGLRLVSDTLEFLDAGGVPRLRMAPPSAQGSDGEPRFVRVELTGCQADVSPRPPWGRPVLPPGSRRCTIRLDWSGLGFSYPLLLDPTWSATGNLAQARALHASATLTNGKVLVTGGAVTAPLSSAELYDPGSGTWAATGAMASVRSDHTATLLANGKVLVVAGNGNAALASAELYDPATGTFSAAASMATGRVYHTATKLTNGRVLIASGQGAGGYLTSAELYDPATNTWSAAGSLSSGRRWHTASLLGDGVLVVGGAANQSFATVERYNPATNQWSAAPAMASARYYHTATVLPNGKLLVAGGDPAGAKSEIYDPTGQVWTATGNMTRSRYIHTAVLLPDGKVLAAGGISNFTTAEIYNPASGTWSATASLSVGHFLHTSSVLADGSVLVVAGHPNQSSSPTATVERFINLPAGTVCTQANTCQSGYCVDGVCCNSACDGACQACNLPSAIGTCSPSSGDACDDGNACTRSDTCQSGTCTGTAMTCEKVACRTQGACVADAGACGQGAPEPDGTPCNGGTCSAGSCVPRDSGSDAADGGGGDGGGPDGGGGDGGSSDDGCSCKVVTFAHGGGGWFWASLTLIAAAIARRRRPAGASK
ncbi:hypothetical protein LVJ94_26000 [Pendulispora rubella]|uniref:Uncharacterized protein n=1 Tax=Pendulispora rubella TaxID=2741070 RepID=A0ABZ2LJT6_9BACT